MFKKFQNELFKNHSCICCEREIPDGTKFSLCKTCFDKLEKISGNICKKCGSEIQKGEFYCKNCEKTNFSFDKNISLFYYNDVASAIVKKMKYSSRCYYAKYIAELMTENLNNFSEIDFLTFVPMSEKKQKQRGFNQAEQIAVEISKITSIPIVDILKKDDDKLNQAKLSASERFLNLKHSFHLKENSNQIARKNILIIDDVFTTGTTLDRCCNEIKNAKPNKIFSMTFAKTKFFKS